ncbi:MAG: hypothetical protein J5990_12350 [Bacteroidales bacterium]|nr:hypothetical protein [Bacteroidales bacterium]
MAKQNNSLTELQALEGIYEHLSTIDDLSKEVGTISTRLRKIEGQLNGPVEIKDTPLLKSKQGAYSRDTCISRTFIITNDIYHRLEEFSNEFNEIKRQQGHIDKKADSHHNEMNKQVDTIITKLLDVDNNTYNYFRITFIMMILISVLNMILWLVIK